MHFPRYWAKATHAAAGADKRPVEMTAWRWSDVSIAEARERAAEAARALVERFLSTGKFPDSYGYADRPLREPVLRELHGADGTRITAITRNAAGAEVLSTDRAMFIDIDFASPASRSPFARVVQLFKKQQPEVPALMRIQAFLDAHRDWGMRVYRTAAGVRVLVTHAPVAPGCAESEQVLDAVEADPLYRRLCTLQESYRARLTPKHWRCDIEGPPVQWPFDDSNAEAAFEGWNARYRRACEPHVTCDLIHTLGNPSVHPDIRPTLELHDTASRVGQHLPLA